MPDVIRLILDDHETFRNRFAELEKLRDAPEAAAELWKGLSAHLEVHASAEEEHFYPALLQHVEDSEDETKDAIKDHDEIRDGIRRAAAAEVVSDEWAGIQDAREANDEHLAEEERDDIPDFLRAASVELRQELGARFERFEDEHPGARGLSGEDKDPDEYVAENS
ncbi:hemerythrin domain-containing protein [Pseudonocardia xinjiangensis]|uniref:Hemerythrin domain-containing protein n=1 Tax=Pseudonocardia xinjiangensis TaxID=75289 RepID=A0ABX1RKC1_9PSEU|nr:hemerythrin domain-containing protein [Pseudonocardia xinjiangensis]NMH79535.1 hemerythrin domain-containing protein [Pseudonocardia xinjiangensis]